MALGTLRVDLVANYVRFKQALTRAEQIARNRAARIRKTFEKMSRSISSSFASAIGGLAVGAAIREFAGFSAAMSNLSAITGATGKDLEYLGEKARELGKTTTLSASEVAESFKLIASAKPDLLENVEALAAVGKEVIALSEASGVEMVDAAKAAASALNQYGAGADQAARFVNVLAAGAKFGASEVADTAEALEKAGTVAKLAGISFEELNAHIQALAAVGIKGADAGTALRNIIVRLQSQAIDRFNPAVVGLTQAMKNLGSANLSTADMVSLVGERTFAATSAIIAQGDKTAELTGKLTGTNTAYEQQAVNMDNLTGDTKALVSAYKDLGIELGTRLDPSLRSITQIFTSLGLEGKALAGTLGSALGFAFKSLATTAILLRQALGTLGEAFGKLGAAIAAVAQGEFSRAWSIMAEDSGNFAARFSSDMDSMIKLWGEFEEKVQKSQKATIGSVIPSPIAPPKLPGGAFSADQAKANKKWMEDAARAARELAAAELELISEGKALAESLRTPFEVAEDKIRRATYLLEQNKISIATFARAEKAALEEAADAFDAMQPKIEKASDEMTKFAEQAASNMQDAFADFLFDPFDKGLKGMFDSFVITLRKMAAEIASAQILKSSGIENFLISGVGALFGGVSGGASLPPVIDKSLPYGGIPKLAGGGSLSAGQLALVGERGPELFMPRTGGEIVPNNKLGGNNITVNITAPSNAGQQSASQFGYEIGRAINTAMRRNG